MNVTVTMEEILGLFSVAKREQTWFHFQGKIQILFFFFIKDWSLPGDFTNFYVQDGLQSAKDIYHINTFIIKCIKKQGGTGIYCTESQLENQ